MRQTNVRDTDQHHYTCEYCFTHFVPKRRPVQKYCSSSCRSKAYRQRTKNNAPVDGLAGLKPKKKKKDETKIDKMSLAGVGNAAVGAIGIKLLTNLLTNQENKPATKADLKLILERIERLQPIKNMQKDSLGRLPYYDTHDQVVVYCWNRGNCVP